MEAFFNSAFYVFAFLAVYVEIFFLTTFLEKHNEIVSKLDDRPDRVYPKVTIIVPCWNEEKTIERTVLSLLGLDYPKDHLQIILVDDGSTDTTWQVFQKFINNPNIKIFKKENGGKHTAMNLGITKTDTEFIGCLDADSFVTPSALKRMIPYFDDKEVMAVSPSIIVNNPTTIMEWAQKVEYQLSVYIKKMLGLMNGIHVTPGPFSIYRLSVFKNLGPYRKAHNTEDMEIAFRMHEHGYRIEQCHDAQVYTNAPKTVYKLYKQRLRWIYGFINNTIDYRRVLFREKYGTFSIFTVPAGIVSMFAAIYLLIFMVYSWSNLIVSKFLKIQAVGIELPKAHSMTFDWFFVSTHAVVFVSVVLYGFVLTSIMIGTKMAEGRVRISFALVWYFIIYSVIAPIWILFAVLNTIFKRQVSWR